MCSCMDKYECWAFSIGLWDVFPHDRMWVLGLSNMIIGLVPTWSDVTAGRAFLTSRSDVSAGRTILTSRSDILKKTYMEDRPTTSMKKGWLCRNSYDEKNHEIAPVMIQIKWWSRSSDDSQQWSRSSDDRDPVMMIQQWWSRSSDDWDPVMTASDDPDREMIQIQW